MGSEMCIRDRLTEQVIYQNPLGLTTLQPPVGHWHYSLRAEFLLPHRAILQTLRLGALVPVDQELWGALDEEHVCDAIRKVAPGPGTTSPLLLAKDRFQAFSISEVMGGIDEVSSIRCEILLPEDGTKEVPVGPTWPPPQPLLMTPPASLGELLALSLSFSSPDPSLQDLLRSLFPHDASSPSPSDPSIPFPIELSAGSHRSQERAARRPSTRCVEGGASFLLPEDLSRIWWTSRRLRSTFA